MKTINIQAKTDNIIRNFNKAFEAINVRVEGPPSPEQLSALLEEVGGFILGAQLGIMTIRDVLGPAANSETLVKPLIEACHAIADSVSKKVDEEVKRDEAQQKKVIIEGTH